MRSLFDRLTALGRKRGVFTPGVSHPPGATPSTQKGAPFERPSGLDISNTITWRRERGLEQKPEAVLFYCTNPAALAKLKAVVHLHQLSVWEPMLHGILVGGETKILDLVVRQWRESLSSNECSDVRGSLFESRLPSGDNVARALLNLEDLDRIIARMSTRWFVRLLATDSVSVVFQPIVSIATSACVACECLVRGEREALPVDAETMLTNARLLGVSHELDRAAWRAAFKQGRGLAQDGKALFLNLTPSSALNPTFNIRAIKAMCRDLDIDISQLVFEVTEAEKVNDFDQLSRIMQEYRDEGAKIALDDLGSGYSSILRLADLRPDYVKLDQRLVHGAYGDHLRSVLLKAVTEAAHKLNIRVVAEGVESEEDLRFCVEIGADLAQGYFLAQPEKIAPAVSADALQVLEECHMMTSVLS